MEQIEIGKIYEVSGTQLVCAYLIPIKPREYPGHKKIKELYLCFGIMEGDEISDLDQDIFYIYNRMLVLDAGTINKFGKIMDNNKISKFEITMERKASEYCHKQYI